MPKIAVIGSGFAGMAAACFLARQGHTTTVYEKNATVGGRARSFSAEGFTFDMGPSWYWMPDTFDRFFAHFGKKTSDYYELVQLDPGFRMVFGKDDLLDIPANFDALCAEFERIEKGSSAKLVEFLKEAKYKYDVAMGDMVYKPCLSWGEFMTPKVMMSAMGLNMFSSVSKQVRKYFKDPRLVALMEFPVLFLGETAKNIPGMYSLMNYAAISMGTWYPMGGMIRIVEAMHQLAEELGVKFVTDCEVKQIVVTNGKAKKLSTSKGDFEVDGVIGAADYHHLESKLLDPSLANYNETYWENRTFAPSSLLFYLGVNKRVAALKHHNLFFDTSLDMHAAEIYEHPQWPSDPLFYVCCPSKTDDSVAPAGKENLFVLIPIAPGIEDTPEIRERYYNMVMERLEKYCEEPLRQHILYNKSYCVKDFVNDYNAYKGNAYGLANTLRQTAVLKPSLKNRRVSNLFYAGQLTVPGPGVPPSLVSGQLAAEQLIKVL